MTTSLPDRPITFSGYPTETSSETLYISNEAVLTVVILPSSAGVVLPNGLTVVQGGPAETASGIDVAIEPGDQFVLLFGQSGDTPLPQSEIPITSSSASSSPGLITTPVSTKTSSTGFTAATFAPITSSTITSSSPPRHYGILSSGAKAGIGVGVGMGALSLLALGAYFWVSRLRRKKIRETANTSSWAKPELPDNPVERVKLAKELDGSNPIYEMDASNIPQELEEQTARPVERHGYEGPETE